MKKRVFLVAMLLGAAPAACTSGPPQSTDKGVLSTQEEAAAVLGLRIVVIPGGLREVQTVVNNYSKTSINHLVIKLFKINGNVETPVMVNSSTQVMLDVLGSELDSVVTIGNLGANATYRIRAYAYKAAGLADSDLISTSDAGSATDVTLTNNDRPTLASLKVKLIDIAFAGQVAPTGVTVTDGGYVPVGTESISL